MRKLTKAEQIANTPIEKIIKELGSDEASLRDKVRILRSSYNRRVQSFKKAYLVSPAQLSLEASLTGPQKEIKTMNRNQLIMEIARYQKFFQSETSTIAGIRKVNKEQDIRLFGSTKGKPKRTMNSEERSRYWSLYEEFVNQNPTSTYRYGSESVQQFLADAFLSDRDLAETDFTEFLNHVESSLQESKLRVDLWSVPNVYSGRRNSF